MFVEVPDPVWKTSTGNWSACSPAITSSAARTIARATSSGTVPISALTTAASRLIRATARTNRAGSTSPDTGKFRRARSVCAP